MLIISKSVVSGTSEKDTLLVIKTKAGTAVEAIEANTTVLKSYDDAVAIYALPVSKAKEEKKLPPGEHRTPPKGYPESKKEYAGPGYTFPVNTESRVRSALAYFTKHPWESSSEKKTAARKILEAAKKFGVEVSKDDDVYRAAHK